jgi:hypothetical protein
MAFTFFSFFQRIFGAKKCPFVFLDFSSLSFYPLLLSLISPKKYGNAVNFFDFTRPFWRGKLVRFNIENVSDLD